MGGMRHHSAINAIGIRLSDAAFAVWRRWSGGDDRSAFYVATRTLLMCAGMANPTLGRKIPIRKWFNPMSLLGSSIDQRGHAERGLREFKLFTSYGISPHHRVIDYGCGSLRMARNFIPFLKTGSYWGFDISKRFINDGIANLEKNGIRSDLGNYRVISPESLTEGREQRADFVISSKVLMHISPENLTQFISQLSTLIHNKTTLIMEFDESETDVRTSGSAWAYSANRLAEVFQAFLPDHGISISRYKQKRLFFNNLIYRSYLTASPVELAKNTATEGLVMQLTAQRTHAPAPDFVHAPDYGFAGGE
jgi:2-polyprenyl-3-methyl-5-hydroxy-6-metoxy-1,4-benzoquinol methylase